MLDKKFHDFRVFITYVWKHLGLPAPTPKQYKIADVAQNVIKAAGVVNLPVARNFTKRYPMLVKADGRITKRLIILAYRGIGKSWINSALAAWVLGLNKDLNIMALSASQYKANEFTKFTLDLISGIPELQDLTPDKTEGDRTSALAFDVRGKRPSHAPSVRSVGITGAITGGRADIAFPDDVETPKTSETQLLRDKLVIKIAEIGGAVVKPETGVVIYLGTPQCEESVYDKLERDHGYCKLIIPARYPSDKWMRRFGHALEPSIASELRPELQTGHGLDGTSGASTDPQRFTETILQEREAEYGRSGFALQYQLDTSLSDIERYPLRLRDLIVTDITDKVPSELIWSSDPDMAWKDEDKGGLPCPGLSGDRFYRPLNLRVNSGKEIEWLSLTQAAMYIDPAGRGGDELAIAIGSPSNGSIFLRKVKGYLAGYERENLEDIARLAKQYHVNEIITEVNFGDGMFNELLRPILRDIYPCTITDSEWMNTQKEKRIIATLEPVMNQHLLVVDPEVIREDAEKRSEESPERAMQRQLFYQMTRITKEQKCLKHDDRLDAVAGLVNYFMKNLGIDQERSRIERKKDAMEKAIQDRMNRKMMLNKKAPARPTWLNFGGKK